MTPSQHTLHHSGARTKPYGDRSNPEKSRRPCTHQSEQTQTLQALGLKVTLKKTNAFARHLTEVYKPHDDTTDPEITRKLTSRPPSSEILQPFTTGELQDVVKHLHPRKAPGPDQITTLMICKKPQEGKKAILHLLNATTRLGYWPRSLKRARIIMILKPGKDPIDVTSYRRISLLPVLSKILEKLLLSRITKDLPPQMWMPSHQFGFRKGHSTIHQCHRLTDIILKAFEDQKYCPAVFLDVSQAFDKVWHPGLLLKIKQTLPYKYFTLLQSYLQHRYLEVSCKNAISPPILMQSRVTQGSILGPFLYTLYTAEDSIPDRPARSQSLYRLSYPAHISRKYINEICNCPGFF